ncbi:MAG: response regulator [Planctomycetes bacterium]|nr:response regulator [Planctomycetota bacterium]
MNEPHLLRSEVPQRRSFGSNAGSGVRRRQRNISVTQPGVHRAFWVGAGRSASASSKQLCPQPAPLGADAESETRRSGNTAIRPKRVLLVEGDTWSRQVLSRMIKGRGLDVCAAGDGFTALQRLHAGRAFDLMLLGLELPGVGGLGLLDRMRADGLQTQVVVLARQASGRTIMACHKFGIAYWLSKPISELELDLALDFTVGENSHEERTAILARLNELTERD